ncbi:MAG: tetrathionate reductase family octaheme c-type cytochrome [Chloroflexi bacterium]|nr:tetrathionate reductase family octaheme c-type cytochrome [Chloroflexota bacterium]
MKNFKFIWAIGSAVTAAIIVTPIVLLISPDRNQVVDPWQYVETRTPDTDHSALLPGPYETGQEVTAACLDCHPDAAIDVSHTTQWTWLAEPVEVEWRDELVETGKANVLNNFCIGIQSNWTGCTRCHAGYGWEDDSFDFSAEENVDCLVCHDQSGTYAKGNAGQPVEGVDLAMAAQSVGTPTRANCGYCHFNGGGGNGVKHGDMDDSLLHPPDAVDVHMGANDFLCIDCHTTEDHLISGRSISVSVDDAHQIACEDCHGSNTHDDDRISAHLESVACVTCHVPLGARRDPTKMHWDWSTAGLDIEEDDHAYLKIKGSFIYESDFVPEYFWYNGTVSYRYLIGDPLDPDGVTQMNPPAGDINDPTAQIWPFKVHVATQPYDTVHNYLLQPQTVGEDGYWTTFDWLDALTRGSETIGLPFSGEFGFAETEMYWPLAHMVVPGEQALQCTDCHGENTRFDWEALGYPGDPMVWGGRD